MIREPKRHTLFYGGARSGKTVLVVKAIMHRAVVAPGSRHAMFLQANSARASLWLETVPIVQKIWFPQFTLRDRIREYGYFEINETGSEVWITGTDDKERIEKILGKEFATLYFNECSQHRYPTIVTLLTRLAQKVYRKDNGRLLLQKAFYDLNPVGTRHFTALLFIRGVDPLTVRPLADMDQRQHAFINPQG